MHFSYGFDIGVQEVILPDFNFMAELHVSELPDHPTGEKEIRRAMAEPIGSPRLRACTQSGKKVVIISALEPGDIMLSSIMPAVLDELYTGGVRRIDITLLLKNSGSLDDETVKSMVGERTMREIRVRTIDLSDTVSVYSNNDFPEIQVYRAAAEADFRVLIGEVHYHHFLGYTGGSESLITSCCPVSSRNILLAGSDVTDDKPAPAEQTVQKRRYDMAAASVGSNFTIDIIRGIDGSVKSVCAGDMIEAHKAGTRYLNAMCLKKLPCPADVAVVSAGGAPYDSYLMPSLSALDHARHAVRKGGSIVFISSCKNGFGSPELERILSNIDSTEELLTLPHEISSDIREACSIIALSQKEHTIWFVSEQGYPLFRKAFPNRMPNAQAALDAALTQAGPGALVLSMPYGIHTVPIYPENLS